MRLLLQLDFNISLKNMQKTCAIINSMYYINTHSQKRDLMN